MNYGIYVRSLFVDTHMHLDLGRRSKALVCLEHSAFRIYLADVFRCHESLAYAGRCAQKFIVVELYRKVSVVCRNHSPVVYALADLTHLFFDFKFVLHPFILLGFFILFLFLYLS